MKSSLTCSSRLTRREPERRRGQPPELQVTQWPRWAAPAVGCAWAWLRLGRLRLGRLRLSRLCLRRLRLGRPGRLRPGRLRLSRLRRRRHGSIGREAGPDQSGIGRVGDGGRGRAGYHSGCVRDCGLSCFRRAGHDSSCARHCGLGGIGGVCRPRSHGDGFLVLTSGAGAAVVWPRPRPDGGQGVHGQREFLVDEQHRAAVG